MDNPFGITLYDKALARTGWIGDPVALTVTPRHNAVGTADITVTSNHRRLPLLVARGARAVITYHGEQIMSGYVTVRTGTGPRNAGTVMVSVQDDLWLLWRMLGWPVPGATLLLQGTKQDSRTGPAETVAKGFVSANLAHNTVDPITVATDLGRGSTITVTSRMKVLADVLMDPVTKAGIGLSARQVGTRIIFDAYTPTVYPHILSEDNGTVLTWTFSDTDQAMTRAVVGGPDVDTSREFREVGVGSADELDLGYTVEGFVDGQSATSHAEMDKAGTDGLGENLRKSGFTLGLSETASFRYGGAGVHVGDQVTLNLGGTLFTDVLKEAAITYDRDNGVTATPTVGDRSDDPDRQLSSFLAAVARGIRDLRTR